MRKDEALKLLCLIEAVYPLIIIKSETVTKWLTLCDVLDYNGVLFNLHVHIQKMPYPPRLYDIATFINWESQCHDLMQAWIEESECDAQLVPWQKDYLIRNQ